MAIPTHGLTARLTLANVAVDSDRFFLRQLTKAEKALSFFTGSGGVKNAWTWMNLTGNGHESIWVGRQCSFRTLRRSAKRMTHTPPITKTRSPQVSCQLVRAKMPEEDSTKPSDS